MQTEAEQSLDRLLSGSNILPADLLRDMPAKYSPEPSMTLRSCLELLAGYHSGYFVLEAEDGSFYHPAAWLRLAPEMESDMPVSLGDPAEIIFEGGVFYDGKLAGTLRVCFVHSLSSPLQAIAEISGVWDIAASIDASEAAGTLEFAIIWHR